MLPILARMLVILVSVRWSNILQGSRLNLLGFFSFPWRWPRKRGVKNTSESIIRNIASQPEGYPKIASILSSDPNFMIYRRFEYLRSRMLLRYQDEIAALERRLDVLDKVDARDKPLLLKSRMRDDEEPDPKRQKLFAQVDEKLKTYGGFVLTQSENARH